MHSSLKTHVRTIKLLPFDSEHSKPDLNNLIYFQKKLFLQISVKLQSFVLFAP